MPFTGLHGELLHPNKTAMLEQLRSNSIQFLKSFHKTQNLNHLPSQGWPLAARENLNKLQQGQAVAVITGQQPCLWGGPALVIHKIATTVSICAWLQREGIPAVPLFWNASEDHDLHEMFQVEGFYPDGRIQSHRKKNERLLSAEALKAQPPSEFPPSFSPWMAKLWGQNQNSWAEQLSHVLMQMFSADGLIALEPRQLAPQSRDFWVSVEARQSQLIQAYDSDEAAITRSGFSLQAPRRHALPIFALHNTGERLSLSQLALSCIASLAIGAGTSGDEVPSSAVPSL